VSRFNSAFARAAVARDRAFGIAAQYRHGDDVLGVTLLLGPRDAPARNTLGGEFAHIRSKEFSIAAAALAIDGELFLPAAGNVITFTDPQNAEQAWTVFPIWNDRCFSPVDNADSQLAVLCVDSGDVSSIGVVGTGGKRVEFLALAGLLRTTQVTVQMGSREQDSDRDIAKLMVACPPGTFSNEQPLTVARYAGGDFFVKSVESVNPQSTRLEVWRERITKLQRRGTEGASR
jgi:hypothetical protein